MLNCRVVAVFIVIIRGKTHMGGAGAAKKTSPEFPAVGDDGNRQNLRGESRPDHIILGKNSMNFRK